MQGILSIPLHGQLCCPLDGGMKVGVSTAGIYLLTYDALKSGGMDPDGIDPNNLQIFTFPTGMLPQSNEPSLQWEMQEIAIHVTGGEDGKFDKQDVILFYGQGPDRIEYRNDKSLFWYENNLYADVNYYFVASNGLNPRRVAKAAAITGAANIITDYADYRTYESDLYNDLKSGRDWFGEILDTRPELTVRFSINDIVANSEIRFVSGFMAQSYSPSSFKVYWNNSLLLDRPMAAIPQTQYGLKGSTAHDTTTVNASTANAVGTSTHDIRVAFTKGSPGRSVGFLDYLLLNVTRALVWRGEPTPFTIPATDAIVSTLQLTGAPPDAIVWDVTNPFDVHEESVTIVSGTLSFGASTETTRSYIAFNKSDAMSPLSVTKFEGTISHETPDLLIITHPLFEGQANRLAAHRKAQYGLDVQVVLTGQIFDWYSGGRQDVSAIRNYIRTLHRASPGKLQNVLLFGRGSYDYKDRVVNNSNYVPTYESRNSLSPLETYSSDDFFVLLEDHEGEWGESPAPNSTLDIGVGRLPVRTADEAAIIVDKLIAYDTDKNRFAGWRKDILFVADDGDWNIHHGDADELAEDIENTYHRFHTNKLYLDAFQQNEVASGQSSPDAAAALERELNKGYAIVNYTGHGNEYVWMNERVLDQDTPYGLVNNPRLPLYVTATCEFGRNDNPLLISTAELLLTQKKGGAIGLVTTARPVHSTTNFQLNKAFYASLFNPAESGKDLGTIFRETKNNSLSGISNRNFSLLGDPSMRFGLQMEEVVVTSVETEDGSETLRPLSLVTVEGEVRRGTAPADFDGVVEVTLHSKRDEFVTRGNENEPFEYKNWHHTLFRGTGSVEGGRFIVLFQLPANMDPAINETKISLYAYTHDRRREALGTGLGIMVGGTPVVTAPDNTGPLIEMFVGDTTFIDGGYANNNTYFIAKLSDDAGINISGYEAYSLTAQLDDGTPFAVNDYYVATLDDATNGKVTVPLVGLKEGPHRITLTAYDSFNNMSVATISFNVGEENQLVIEEFMGYPNPFSQAEPATFKFTHSRSGDDLEAQLLIYNSMGQLAEEITYYVPSSGYTVTLGSWNGQSSFGSKLGAGIYLARVSVRSLSDGAKNAKIAKLFLVN
jgi:hypothetical protein